MYSNVQDGNILFAIAPHHSSAVPTLMSIAYQTSSGSHSSNVRTCEFRFGIVDTKIGLFSQCSSRINGGLWKAQLHFSLDIVDK